MEHPSTMQRVGYSNYKTWKQTGTSVASRRITPLCISHFTSSTGSLSSFSQSGQSAAWQSQRLLPDRSCWVKGSSCCLQLGRSMTGTCLSLVSIFCGAAGSLPRLSNISIVTGSVGTMALVPGGHSASVQVLFSSTKSSGP